MKNIILFTIKKCNFRCGNAIYGCIAGCQRFGGQTGIEMDFAKAAQWLQKYTPNANVHVSGGEPFLHSKIRHGLELLISNGHDVTIFTNAALLPANPWAYGLRVKWHITHHPFSIEAADFLKSIEPLKNKPHVITRIFAKGTKPPHDLESIYEGYNFMWREANGGYYGVAGDAAPECPNETIMMINEYGQINPCSAPAAVFGSIEDTSFDAEAAGRYRCPAAKWPHDCPVRQTAQIMEATE